MSVDFKRLTDRSLKVLICLVLCFICLYVQPKENLEEAEAALPAVLVAVLGAVVLDIAVDMGIEFIDKKAGKDWANNIVGKLWNKYGKKISDLKPTKTNAGKWTIKLGKDLLALIVDEIGDTIEDVVEEDRDRKKRNSDDDGDGYVKKFESEIDTGSSEPFYNTSLYVTKIYGTEGYSPDLKMAGYFNEWLNYQVTPVSYKQKSRVVISTDKNFGDSSDLTLYFKGGYSGGWRITTSTSSWLRIFTDSTSVATSEDGSYNNYAQVYGIDTKVGNVFAAYPAYEKYLERLELSNAKTYYADGVITTDGFDSYIDLPDDKVLSDDVLKKIDYSKFPTALQKDRDFEFEINDSTVIDAEYEVINEGDEFEWEIIEQDIVNQGDNIYKTYNYDYEPTINNYYTVSESQQGEIENEISIIIDNEVTVPPSSGGGGNYDIDVDVDGFKYCVEKATSGVIPCKDIEAIDGSLLEYVENAYDYGVNAVKAGVNGINTIVAGSAGLLTLYSNIFDWLPDEATVILTSGLLLMIGLRVFRR